MHANVQKRLRQPISGGGGWNESHQMKSSEFSVQITMLGRY